MAKVVEYDAYGNSEEYDDDLFNGGSAEDWYNCLLDMTQGKDLIERSLVDENRRLRAELAECRQELGHRKVHEEEAAGSEFFLTLFELIMGRELTKREQSLIDDCFAQVYNPVNKSKSPYVLIDLYRKLLEVMTQVDEWGHKTIRAQVAAKLTDSLMMYVANVYMTDESQACAQKLGTGLGEIVREIVNFAYRMGYGSGALTTICDIDLLLMLGVDDVQEIQEWVDACKHFYESDT